MKSNDEMIRELEELRMQLQEATDTIEAIRSGQVDALVVKNGEGHQLYTLKSADQTYRVFIEKMKEGAVTLSRDGIILYSNSQFASMVNLPLANVIGLSFMDFIPAEYREFFSLLMSLGWESDSKGEIMIRNMDDVLIPFLLSFTSLELDEGKALSLILTDLSVQKESERQLMRNNKQLEEAQLALSKINENLEVLVLERTKELFVSREHFKFLADNIPVKVWATGPDGRTNYVNKQWLLYTGLSYEASIGTGWKDAIHPDDLDMTLKAWNEALETTQKFEIEYRLRRAADGEYRWHLVKGEPFIDEKGEIIAWLGTSTDIEDQRQEINRKDEFISVASHELRTPLTSLKGYMQLMGTQQNLPDNTKLYISRGNNSINKLQHLINDLLDASKIKAGKLEYEKGPVDLTRLIRTCLENSKYMYPSYEIEQDIPEGIMVYGNEERLEQVLMNLVNNAVKYSPQNKRIIVKATTAEEKVVVSVTDFGVGMSEADQEKVFERFYRAEDNKSTPGLGIGLYISAEIIKEHNGRVAVKSKLKEGSVFSFTLPLLHTAG